MARQTFVLAVVGMLVACSSGAGPVAPVAQAHSPIAAARSASPVPTPSPTPPPLTIGGLFHPGAPFSTDPAHVRTMIATGDIIPARLVDYYATQKNDFLWPFRPTADYVKNADVTFGNLESPLFAGCKLSTGGLTFCGDARFVSGLQLDGIDVVNLANNHTNNFGAQGINATVDLLNKNGIQSTGLGPPAIVDVRGLKFAFLGYNGVGLPVDRNAMQQGIAFARQQADVVVVQFHWGKEYERQPIPDPGVPTPDDPVEIGHMAIDAGADIVIGNHPHWYQPIEIYKGKLITYAHGNFVFDQMWSEETREGVIGTYTFYDNKLIAASWKPIRIYDYGQPRFEDATYDQKVLGTMEQASKDLATRLGEPAV
jgi:poly-gamma-glutamate synthesis protein (capsule biosynthesis protein)